MDSFTRESAFADWLARKRSQKRLQLGISFKDLHVYGFTSSIRFQATAVSYALAVPRYDAGFLSHSPDGKVQILQNFQGLALAGDTHGILLDHRSHVNYEGVSYRRMHHDFKGEYNYLAELDVQFPELTLGQTLRFAASIRDVSTSKGSIAARMGKVMATLFGLEPAFNTWIGSPIVRGDNSTRGLDSSTAQQFVELLRDSTDELSTTMVISIYQASEAIYQKFNKVTIFYEGR
ncbi:hypothetical protein F4778DRAFT_785202 [Xylariomycetidae sp. FL2044]|nr:hypothetical protein F4778DRAFT_785202 [Xylariomycetidae sp. FL2044]